MSCVSIDKGSKEENLPFLLIQSHGGGGPKMRVQPAVSFMGIPTRTCGVKNKPKKSQIRPEMKEI
jgi:hypothetical protein